MVKNSRKIIRSRDIIFNEEKPKNVEIVEITKPNYVVGNVEHHKEIKDVLTNDQSREGTPFYDANDKFEVESTQNIKPVILSNSTIRRQSTRVTKPPARYGFTNDERGNMAVEIMEPGNYEEAIQGRDSKEWTAAIKDELNSLIQNGTWEETPLPMGRKPISCKWIFKIKRDADGNVARYKARLVARGFTQEKGIDYNETFAPVAKYTSIRAFLSIAAIEDMEVHQLDVKTAYLNGTLEEEIYMTIPEGLEPTNPGNVLRLRKTIYGLKQSGRAWYKEIDQKLQELGFLRCQSDHSIYVKYDDSGEKILISIYVDDLMIATKNEEALKETKELLKESYKMTDLGELNYLLGIKITRDRKRREFRMSQQAYIDRMLQEFNMDQCKGIATPMDKGDLLPIVTTDSIDPETPYRQAIGKLMYTMVSTRPDIAYPVSVLSRYMANPDQKHWKAIKRIFRYLKETRELGLVLGGSDKVTLEGYSDSDFAGDKETRRSTSAYIFKIGEGTISWMSKKQDVVATSTTEAEYMALGKATSEALWLKRFLEELGYKLPAVKIYGDNQSSIALAKNPQFHPRTKHIDVRFHFIRERIEKGEIILKYLRTDEMLADLLTKAHGKAKNEELRAKLNLRNEFDPPKVGVLEFTNQDAADELITEETPKIGTQRWRK